MNPTHVTDDLQWLRRRVRELTDREEITDLVYRLSVALDEGRFEELKSIFTDDAVAQTPGGLAQGRDALIAQAARNHSSEERIQHLIGNVLIDMDGDRADVRANLLATFASPGTADAQDTARLAPEPRLTLGEVYRFQAVRTPHGWRLSRVETTPLWTTGRSRSA
ncbi:nuclear transport factor 2 family protein [Thermostaphylospora chromogena]|uniref:SnoaL-like domain-containing protein n=1 Tax=Thermostaphylospora chromogena TaxID=35622 RepID=A0A1H1DJF1_9ACTN|nr:nuclear transport factor 2 family protein [Thermostaphylospora chromogena]SDQ76557.1 SnoaL-like domain-containing protein [Thermostaphylospora chromogena]